MRAVLTILGVVACATLSRGEVIPFNLELGPDYMVYRRIPMFAADESPAAGPLGDGQAHVTLDLTVQRITSTGVENDDAYIQVSIMTEEEFDKMGVEAGGDREYCCQEKGSLDGVCPSSSALAIPDAAARKMSIPVFPPARAAGRRLAEAKGGEKFTTTVQTRVNLFHTGFYYIVFSSCNPGMDVVSVKGSTLWASPYGYMPANMYQLLPFYRFFTFAYVAAAALWAALCVRHRDSLMTVHSMVSVVMALGLVDAASRYYEFSDFNKTGTRSTSVFVMALIARCAKRTVSRALVLVVSLGYGVSKPTLGADFYKIIGLSAAYLVAMVWSELIQAFLREDTIPPSEFLLLFVIANLDVIFYFWIFRAIVVTTTVLERTRQTNKLKVYTYFRNLMAAAVVASLVWAVYYTVAAGTGALERDWSGQWVFDAYWEVLYFVVLAAIGYLWRPTENSLRYAYMQELATTEADARDEEDEGYLGDVAREEADVQAALDAEMEGETEGKAGPHSDAESDGHRRHPRHVSHHHVAGSDAERAGLATNLSSDSEDGDI